jgi:uncharacterized RDD family membrane protein YckC
MINNYSTSPVKTTLEHAGFWRRFAAYLIDSVIISVCYWIFSFILGLFFGGNSLTDTFRHPDLYSAFIIIIMVIIWIALLMAIILYYTLMESSLRQATLGKMAMGIRVTNLNGGRISFANALGRYFAKIISAIILYIGFIMIAFTGKKQGLHDMIANTLVVIGKPETVSAGPANLVPPQSNQQNIPQPPPYLNVTRNPVPKDAVLRLPDSNEIQLPQTTRSFGRTDFEKSLSPNSKDFISREHFFIKYEGEKYFIEDRSLNGTKLNGVGIKGKVELMDGDRITLANILDITFKLG